MTAESVEKMEVADSLVQNPHAKTARLVGGTIRRKVIHRASCRASVLQLSEIQAQRECIAAKKCLSATYCSFGGLLKLPGNAAMDRQVLSSG
jgi:hypothetical protein